MPISQETLTYELLHAAKLDNKQRGELAELAFMRKAATLGFGVSKPWGDSDRYDVVLRAGRVFWRVQVKSVWAITGSRRHYRVRTSGTRNTYTAEQIDFLVAYLFPEDSWYVFPAPVVENRHVICIRPGHTKSRFEPYREAWKLMWTSEPELQPPELP